MEKWKEINRVGDIDEFHANLENKFPAISTQLIISKYTLSLFSKRYTNFVLPSDFIYLFIYVGKTHSHHI